MLAAPACAEEKGTLDRVYEGATKAAGKLLALPEKPHIVDKNKQPQIIIKGGELRYNGHQLKFGDTYSSWVTVLGKPSRFSGDNIYTWDNLGIVAVLKARGADGPGFTNKITQLDVFLNHKPRDPIFEHIPNFRPKKTFPGYLEIDGASVDSASKVWEVNRYKNMFGNPEEYGFTQDYLPTIFRAVSPPPKLDMSFHTDKKGLDGLIYHLSVGD